MRAECKENFQWKFLARSRRAGNFGGEKEQLGIAQTQARADHQENQTIRL